MGLLLVASRYIQGLNLPERSCASKYSFYSDCEQPHVPKIPWLNTSSCSSQSSRLSKDYRTTRRRMKRWGISGTFYYYIRKYNYTILHFNLHSFSQHCNVDICIIYFVERSIVHEKTNGVLSLFSSWKNIWTMFFYGCIHNCYNLNWSKCIYWTWLKWEVLHIRLQRNSFKQSNCRGSGHRSDE